ncbi:MAG TPA: hypothetical protein VM120_27715, partial [Bryobacteraceae bacterium]|nr:hypothetical protein [Bryobacteraceae bacterium]
MANPLLDVSDQLVAAVQAAGEFVLAVAAHPRAAASGIHWREGVVVSTAHTLKSRSAVELTLP